MKKLLLGLTLLASLSSFGQSPMISDFDVAFNKSNLNIELSVTYTGCAEQEFELNFYGCLESSPVECEAEISTLENSTNSCDTTHTKSYTYTAAQHNHIGDYYDGGSLTVYMINESSEIEKTVQLHRSCNYLAKTLEKAESEINSDIEAWRNWAKRTIEKVTKEMSEKQCKTNTGDHQNSSLGVDNSDRLNQKDGLPKSNNLQVNKASSVVIQ